MIKKAYKVMLESFIDVIHIYHQRWLLPYSDKWICPKIHEDTSLAAGPCFTHSCHAYSLFSVSLYPIIPSLQ